MKPTWTKHDGDHYTCDIGRATVEVNRTHSPFTGTYYIAWVWHHPQLGTKRFHGRGALAAAKKAATEMGQLTAVS